MAKFVAISGPSSSGKTLIAEELNSYQCMDKVVFIPDILNTVWSGLVEEGYFTEYEEIAKDSEYICVFIMHVLEYYNSILEKYEESDCLVFLDCSWVDILVYSLVNVWISRPIKSLQEEIIRKILELVDSVDSIYLTQFDESKHRVEKYKSEFKIYSSKANRSLELKYYDMMKNLNHVILIPTTEKSEASYFIYDSLKNLGYL